MRPQEVLALCRQEGIKAVDLRFADLLGTWQHITIPVKRLDEDVFEDGLGFDGSSIRGWQSIDESDMLIVPQPGTAFVDPFAELPTLNLICNIVDPATRQDYNRDSRNIARKAENFLKSSGIADATFFGPKPEFFILDDARFDQNAHEGYYHLDSIAGEWNRGRAEAPNLAHKVPRQLGYSPVPPADHWTDIRNEIMQTLIKCDIKVECHHHEVATAGQAEIDLRHGELVRMADQVMIYKYIVKNVARRREKTATFMPKPVMGDNGSGMHTHFSMWKNENPLFAGGGYGGLSDLGMYAIGGLLAHAPSLLAFTNPTTNSYKRLVPGHEAPVLLTYSKRNRSAACRIPIYSQSPNSKRVEFRCPDPSCNPYLAFAAMLMAIIDGIRNKIHPGDALEKNVYHLPSEQVAGIPHVPVSLEQALDCLEADHEFLMIDEVFTKDVIELWLQYKRDHDVAAIRSRPHPYEFCMYYDV